MTENWDNFPTNIDESLGSIARRPFTFPYTRFEVWHEGACVMSGPSTNTIHAKVIDNQLHVSIHDRNVNEVIKKDFSFGEISTINNRILWSKDIMNVSGRIEKFNPDLSSLFYQNGRLAKVTFTIHDPNLLVEFYQ
ncbi:hypothetical protein [Hymenobacter guriensis]|uniref:Uncharacterized protein n=1 Tax=Hymenobacter guriensis TaxID=2793065 RepID=A0ABS0L1K2_9BACT|nr:hypothetical protein [Hymenobacter guriensis]MBG8553989.1 hypothetical protein [Hymenobacter guriensis]